MKRSDRCRVAVRCIASAVMPLIRTNTGFPQLHPVASSHAHSDKYRVGSEARRYACSDKRRVGSFFPTPSMSVHSDKYRVEPRVSTGVLPPTRCCLDISPSRALPRRVLMIMTEPVSRAAEQGPVPTTPSAPDRQPHYGCGLRMARRSSSSCRTGEKCPVGDSRRRRPSWLTCASALYLMPHCPGT